MATYGEVWKMSTLQVDTAIEFFSRYAKKKAP